MALALGTGPFGQKSTGAFNFDTGVLKPHTLYFEDSPKRVRGVFEGETVVDSRSAKLLHETGHLPVYYFPEEDLRQDLLETTDHTTHCPFKGDASYRSVKTGDRVAENAVWNYPDPQDYFAPLKGYAAFYWGKMDKWYEEDEEVIGHPHDPYHRVDVLDSSRYVRVLANGELVAETSRPRLLFETGLPVRYYFPAEDVREDLLVPSKKQTVCPYKGFAAYRSVKTGNGLLEDAAWLYDEPLPEAQKVRGYLSFLGDGIEHQVEN